MRGVLLTSKVGTLREDLEEVMIEFALCPKLSFWHLLQGKVSSLVFKSKRFWACLDNVNVEAALLTEGLP